MPLLKRGYGNYNIKIWVSSFSTSLSGINIIKCEIPVLKKLIFLTILIISSTAFPDRESDLLSLLDGTRAMIKVGGLSVITITHNPESNTQAIFKIINDTTQSKNFDGSFGVPEIHTISLKGREGQIEAQNIKALLEKEGCVVDVAQIGTSGYCLNIKRSFFSRLKYLFMNDPLPILLNRLQNEYPFWDISESGKFVLFVTEKEMMEDVKGALEHEGYVVEVVLQ